VGKIEKWRGTSHESEQNIDINASATAMRMIHKKMRAKFNLQNASHFKALDYDIK
jgi:ribosomal protein L28